MLRKIALTFWISLAFSAAASAYTVKLKDGSLIFAKMKYTVRGSNAIITLPNGIVTQIALDTIDLPGTEKYNKENPGNVIALNAPGEEVKPVPTAEPKATVQEMIQRNKTRMEIPPSNPVDAAPKEGSPGQSWAAVDTTLQEAFARVFEGAGISQYRLQSFRGTVKLLATTNTEEAVFNTLAAAARALSDYANRGNQISIEISLTTSSGENAGSFVMTTESARLLVNGGVMTQDYFVRNVVL